MTKSDADVQDALISHDDFAQPRTARSLALSGFAFAATTLFLIWAGYVTIFTHFSPWDDEGFFVMSLKWFHRSGGIYGGPYVVYGPLYYEFMDAVLTGLRLPFTHDSGRLVSLGLWVAISLICGLMIARISNVLIGCWAQLLLFKTFLPDMALEPSHPEELLCLVLSCLAASALFISMRPRVALALQGLLLACLFLVKINVGGFASLALLFIYAVAFDTRSYRRFLIWSTAALFILAPSALMFPRLGEDWVRRYVFVTTIAAVVVAIAAIIEFRSPTLHLRHLAWSAGAAVVGGLLVTAPVLLAGTPLQDLLDGILFRPARYRSRFGIPVQLGPNHRTIALVSLAMFVFVMLYRRRHADGMWTALVRIAAGVLIAHSVSMVFLKLLPIGFTFVPLAWVAMIKPSGVSDSPELRWLRLLLPPLAVLQTLQAFPMAGSQVTVGGSFLLVPAGAICVVDGWRQLATQRLHASVRYAALCALVAVAFLQNLRVANGERIRYASGVGLPLPGATRMRLPAEQQRTLLWLHRTLEERCADFVTLPALNSLYLWAQRDPPMGVTAETWWYDVPFEQQAGIVERIRSVERLCVVRRPELIDFWSRVLNRPSPSSLVIDYLRSGFMLLGHENGYEVWVRSAPRERAATPSVRVPKTRY